MSDRRLAISVALLLGSALLSLFFIFQTIGNQDKEAAADDGAGTEHVEDSSTGKTEDLTRSERGKVRPAAALNADTDASLRRTQETGAEIILGILRAGQNARTAGEHARSLRELAEYEPHYAAKRARDLKEYFCNPDHISAALQIGTPDELIEDRKAYCEDLDDAVIAEILDLADSQQPDSDDYVNKLLTDHPIVASRYELADRLESASDDERSNVFGTLVRSAGTPEEMMNLIHMNHSSAREQGGWPMWELGQDIRQEHHPLANLLQAQGVALQLYSCELFGGCGDGQLVRMLWCGPSRFGGPCPPGTSLEDLLYMTTPPADWLLAEEILRRLRSP